MKKLNKFAVLMIFCFIFIFASGCGVDAAYFEGTYKYSSSSYIEVTEFYGTDGCAIAYNVVIPNVNNGKAYSTP